MKGQLEVLNGKQLDKFAFAADTVFYIGGNKNINLFARDENEKDRKRVKRLKQAIKELQEALIDFA